jgi:membrane-anchored protein YejM (alkaline phosphatase superfamily)
LFVLGTFTYRLKGFKQQPTDHYTRTFFQFAEKFERNWKCSGSVPQHKVWFQYADRFMRNYPEDVPKFGLMHHSMLSHDSANEVQNADADLKSLLKGLNDDGLFNQTVVIVMADHGHRFSELRATQQGKFIDFYLTQSLI